ncbi:MAG: 1,4-alpha-glucan branching protein GlgB [Lachnospiraceae bacterium]|nr:1,4-alpha-glucan branching protein GlgB [Lachnospiraceae bacterium]
MDDKLYDMMDWARIEGLIYSEEDQPHDILGPHMTDDGVLIQTFLPTAESILVKEAETGKTYPMQVEDETGFFAVLIPGQKIPDYRLVVTYDDGSSEEFADPYAFQPQITEKDMVRFKAGICYDIYNKLGAHPMTVNGVEGVYFAVWAPNAMRVSVVGDFNLWDGRRLPMRRLPEAGIFELFVPGIKPGSLYKYEIKARSGLTYLKADPFANAAQLRPETASVVTDIRGFQWTDEEWQNAKKDVDVQKSPMSVYEVHLGAWKKPDDGRLFYNYRELAPMLADYILRMGYTHLELLPVMEHPLDESLGYQTSGYFAPTARYGTPEDFMYFMNYMHEKKIPVILDWAPAHFPADDFCLRGFDGTCLYEHMDPRQGRNEKYGTLLYNYGRAEVRNFLIASALFWVRVYHADGIRVDGVSAMLYLDYGKSDGQWIANMYGGNENLEAIEFIKHLNSIFKKTELGTFMIAQEDSLWPKVTAPVEEDGLGFDLKWNEGWVSDFTGYMELDPIFRGRHHGELTLSMIYHYSENYLLPFSHKEVMYGKGSMFVKMPGKRKNKFANLRAAYGFQVMHPGKQLVFMGQDMGIRSEFSVGEALPWNLAEEEDHAKLLAYMKALEHFYTENRALYELDNDPDGFEWINEISANENMLVFLRKGREEKDTLLVVCNFSPLVYEKHKIGVPFAGKYKEIFSSDRVEFGGDGNLNPRVKNSRFDECDGRDESIYITVPPMGICVFSCARAERSVSANDKAKSVRAKKSVPSGKKTSAGTKRNLKEEIEKKIAEEEH